MFRVAGFWLTFSYVMCSHSELAFAHGSGESAPDTPLSVRSAAQIASDRDTGSFVNFETPHVHPLDINPSGRVLAACNTPDSMVELFAIAPDGLLDHLHSVRVGYAPVSVRFRTDDELWVVNAISDSISVVDVVRGLQVNTLRTYDVFNADLNGDSPADVVFPANGTAVISCSGSDLLHIRDAATHALVGEVPLAAESPRTLALAPDGQTVFVGHFESGNRTTLLVGRDFNEQIDSLGLFPPVDALRDPSNPYQGQNPPFNDGLPGAGWRVGNEIVFPDMIPRPPRVSLIVKQDSAGVWRDDNGADWTAWITGEKAQLSGRFPGWTLVDQDVTVLAATGMGIEVGAIENLMNICMASEVNPQTGELFVVGTDATNEIRFEPNLQGTFVRVKLAIVDVARGEQSVLDLNQAHLAIAQLEEDGIADAYHDGRVPTGARHASIGDPRGIAFVPDGSVAYISGMGSNNIVGVDASTGERITVGHSVAVGRGPTGLVHHPHIDSLYVLNKFDSTVSVVDTSIPGQESLTQTIAVFDPTPSFINAGRELLYDTHRTSGLGQASCASCHVDARLDRLAWDLGNPAAGEPLGVEMFTNSLDLIFGESGSNPPKVHNASATLHGTLVHTMKGPMTTQSLRDIIGKEPFHWRGDRDGLEAFAGAFVGLMGSDAVPSAVSMRLFEDMLSTVHFPPNPFRAPDNSLAGGPTIIGPGENPRLHLNGFYSPGPTEMKPQFSSPGTPLPSANAWRGFRLYMDAKLNFLDCGDCHALPVGAGTTIGSETGLPIPFGPNGEAHLAMAGGIQAPLKVPQLRNQAEREGLTLNQGDVQGGGNPALAASRAGFGLQTDGAIDGLARFLAEPVFTVHTDQDLADLLGFVLSIRGGGFDDLFSLPDGPVSRSAPASEAREAHAAIGRQLTIRNSTLTSAEEHELLVLLALSDRERVGLIASTQRFGQNAGWLHVSGDGLDSASFQPDTVTAPEPLDAILAGVDATSPLTFMAVPVESAIRMGLDRDENGVFNRDESVTSHGGGSCFIATAVYGTPSAHALHLLRAWRNDTLMKSRTGVLIADLYYRASPPIASFIARHERARTVVRVPIALLVSLIEGRHYNASTTPIVAILLFAVHKLLRRPRTRSNDRQFLS